MNIPNSGMSRTEFLDRIQVFDMNTCEHAPFVGVAEIVKNGPEGVTGPAVIFNLVPEVIHTVEVACCSKPITGHTQVIIANGSTFIRQDMGTGLGEWSSGGSAKGSKSSPVDTSKFATVEALAALTRRVTALETASTPA